MEEMIKRLEQMMAANDPATMEYLAEVSSAAVTAEDKARLDELASRLMAGASEGLDRVEDALGEQLLRDELGPLAEALNMSYIARTYFGKSRSWLCQRLNGNSVNGHQVTLSAEERETLNAALRDIQSQINVFTRIA